LAEKRNTVVSHGITMTHSNLPGATFAFAVPPPCLKSAPLRRRIAPISGVGEKAHRLGLPANAGEEFKSLAVGVGVPHRSPNTVEMLTFCRWRDADAFLNMRSATVGSPIEAENTQINH
jgi:hypothetical protein